MHLICHHVSTAWSECKSIHRNYLAERAPFLCEKYLISHQICSTYGLCSISNILHIVDTLDSDDDDTAWDPFLISHLIWVVVVCSFCHFESSLCLVCDVMGSVCWLRGSYEQNNRERTYFVSFLCVHVKGKEKRKLEMNPFFRFFSAVIKMHVMSYSNQSEQKKMTVITSLCQVRTREDMLNQMRISFVALREELSWVCVYCLCWWQWWKFFMIWVKSQHLNVVSVAPSAEITNHCSLGVLSIFNHIISS